MDGAAAETIRGIHRTLETQGNWFYTLFLVVPGIVITVVEEVAELGGMIAGVYGPMSAVLALGTLVPGIAVGVRRLHDIDRSGWWMLLEVPIYAFSGLGVFVNAAGDDIQSAGLALGGSLVVAAAGILLVFMLTEGTAGANRFGANPKDPYQTDVFA